MTCQTRHLASVISLKSSTANPRLARAAAQWGAGIAGAGQTRLTGQLADVG
jgi:hypothetical protein